MRRVTAIATRCSREAVTPARPYIFRKRRIRLGANAEALLFDPIDLKAVRTAFSCPPELAERILEFGRVRRYAPGSHLLRQGDVPAVMYLIVLGRCHALLFAADGQIVLLHELGEGDLFGALGGLDAMPEDADVVAIEEVRSFLLEAGILVSLAERYGCIGLALSRILLKRLRAASSRIYERSALSAAGRVCAELLRLAQAGGGVLIRPAPVIAELAVRVGTTRETASRAVSALERRGIIRREVDALVVVAPERLGSEIL